MLKHSSADEQAVGQGERQPTLPELFDAEESNLLRYAFSLLRRRAIAEEIVQDVFLQLHAKWNEVAEPRNWLYRSVRNRAFNHVRDHRQEVTTQEPLELVDDARETAEAMMLRLEAAGVLRETIDRLDQEDRRLVELKYFEGMSYRQIAEATGLSVGNVGYRLHHILKQLADSLRPLGMDQQS